MSNTNSKSNKSSEKKEVSLNEIAYENAKRCIAFFDNEYLAVNYAWSMCNSTHYMLANTKTQLMDTRAQIISNEVEGQEMSTIQEKAIERQGYLTSNYMDLAIIHNADLKVYLELSGKPWVKARAKSNRPTGRHSNLESLADQIIAGNITI